MAHVRSVQSAPGALRGSAITLVLGVAFLVLGDTVAEDGRVRADRWLDLGLHRHLGAEWTRPMRLATDLGSAYVAVPAIVALVGWLWWRQRRRTAGLAAVFWIGAQLIDLTTKSLYHRDRPSLFPAFARAGGYSFPSGHTVTAVVTYGLMVAIVTNGWRGWRQWLPLAVAVVAVVVVAISRVYLGVHYPSDVAGGILIGGSWLRLALLALAAIERRGTIVRPDMEPPRLLPPSRVRSS